MVDHNPIYKRNKTSGSLKNVFGSQIKCFHCKKTVYDMEKIMVDEQPFHKSCFRCAKTTCHRQLSPSDFVKVGSKYYCAIHGKEKQDKDSHKMLRRSSSSGSILSMSINVPTSPSAMAAAASRGPKSAPQSEIDSDDDDDDGAVADNVQVDDTPDPQVQEDNASDGGKNGKADDIEALLKKYKRPSRKGETSHKPKEDGKRRTSSRPSSSSSSSRHHHHHSNKSSKTSSSSSSRKPSSSRSGGSASRHHHSASRSSSSRSSSGASKRMTTRSGSSETTSTPVTPAKTSPRSSGEFSPVVQQELLDLDNPVSPLIAKRLESPSITGDSSSSAVKNLITQVGELKTSETQLAGTVESLRLENLSLQEQVSALGVENQSLKASQQAGTAGSSGLQAAATRIAEQEMEIRRLTTLAESASDFERRVGELEADILVARAQVVDANKAHVRETTELASKVRELETAALSAGNQEFEEAHKLRRELKLALEQLADRNDEVRLLKQSMEEQEDGLKKELLDLERETEQMMDSNSGLKVQVEQLQAAEQKMKIELNKAAQTIVDKEMEMKEIRAQAEQSSSREQVIDSQIDKLTQRLAEATHEKNQLARDHDALKEELKTMETERTELSEAFTAFKQETDALMDSTTKQVEASKSGLANEEAQKRALEEQCKLLDMEAMTMQARLDELCLDKERLETELAASELAAGKAAKSVARLENLHTATKKRLAEVEVSYSSLAEQFESEKEYWTSNDTSKNVEVARKLGKLEGDNKVLREKVGRQDTMLDEREVQVSDLEAELGQLKKDHAKLTTTNDAAANQLDATKDKLVVVENAKELLLEELESAQHNEQLLVKKIEEMDAEIRSLQVARVRDVKALTDDSGMRASLQQELDNMQGDLELLTQQYTELKARAQLLEGDRDGLRKEKQELVIENHGLEEDVTELKEAKENVEMQLKWAQDKNAKLKAEMEKSNKLAKELKGQLHSLSNNREQIEADLSTKAVKWEVERDQILEELRQAASREADLESQLESAADEHGKLEMEIERQQKELASAQDEKAALESDLSKKDTELVGGDAKFEEEKKYFMTELTKAAEREYDLEATIEETQTQVEDHATKNRALQTELQSLEADRRHLLQQITDAASREFELEQQVDNLTAEVGGLRENVSSAEDTIKNSTVAKRLLQVEEELAQTKSALEHALENERELEQELEMKHDALEVTRKKLASLNDENEDLRERLEEAEEVLLVTRGDDEDEVHEE